MVDEENEEDEEDGEGKVSMLKLFLMMVLDDDNNDDEDSWTPKRRSPISFVVKDVHVLQLCPMLPQCEHFLLAIITNQNMCLIMRMRKRERKVRKRIGLVV